MQQALALFDPVPIYVTQGDTVIVAGTKSEIDSLTPTEISQLAAIGVTTVEVSNLTGAWAAHHQWRHYAFHLRRSAVEQDDHLCGNRRHACA